METNENWYKIFLRRMLILGVVLVLLIPPVQAADETTHFYNAFSLSRGDFYPEYAQGTYTGRSFPKAIQTYMDSWNSGNVHVRLSDINKDFFTSPVIDYNDTVFVPYWASETNLVGYIFSGAGMFLASIIGKIVGLSASPYGLLIAGRLFNLFFYICAAGYAIKISPCFKKTLLLLALMPMAFFQAATISYDALLIPSCFLLFAVTMRGIHTEQKITAAAIGLMCFISVILFNVKTVYAPLLLGLAFIPKERFGGTRNYILAGGAIIGSGLGILVLNRILFAISTVGYINPYGALYEAQFHHLMSHLFGFWGYIANSFVSKCGFYYKSFIGFLGQWRVSFPLVVLVGYGLVLIGVAWFEARKGRVLNCVGKILMGLMILLIIYASFAGIYTTWTAIEQGVGVNWVDGIQGRYFIPIAIYIPMICSYSGKKQLSASVSSFVDRFTWCVATAIPLLTVVLVFCEYWEF